MGATVTNFAAAVKNKLTNAGRIETMSRSKNGNVFLTVRHDRATNVLSHIVLTKSQIPDGLEEGVSIQYIKAEGCRGYRKRPSDKPIFFDHVAKPQVIKDSKVLLGLFIQHERLPADHTFAKVNP